MSSFRFQCSEVPQVTHCPTPIVPSPPPQECPLQCNTCNCGFNKSKLFCTSDNGVLNVDVLPGVDFWQTVATLEICQENCSEVLHEVTGLVSLPFLNTSATPDHETIIFNLTFRIIDEFGKEVCRHNFNYGQDVTIPPNTSITIDLPFHFKCCDKPRQCECNTTYRLQVSSTSSIETIIRDVTWAAIVWENC
ncbi:hypothetical protein [Lysinibacillus sp. NPDC093688]|uniref:hypothetical protein n=1 Tax=Lysinibacillus sp. NPDC093688 TaxID=3390577 RepID=UPI003D03FD8F